MGYDEYTDLINHGLPPESPALFGLPSNAEINFLSAEADFTFKLRRFGLPYPCLFVVGMAWWEMETPTGSLIWSFETVLSPPTLLCIPHGSTVMELSGATGGSGGESKESRVRAIVEDIMARIPDNPLDMLDINARVEMRTPYVLVCLQVCDTSSRYKRFSLPSFHFLSRISSLF